MQRMSTHKTGTIKTGTAETGNAACVPGAAGQREPTVVCAMHVGPDTTNRSGYGGSNDRGIPEKSCLRCASVAVVRRHTTILNEYLFTDDRYCAIRRSVSDGVVYLCKSCAELELEP